MSYHWDGQRKTHDNAAHPVKNLTSNRTALFVLICAANCLQTPIFHKIWQILRASRSTAATKCFHRAAKCCQTRLLSAVIQLSSGGLFFPPARAQNTPPSAASGAPLNTPSRRQITRSGAAAGRARPLPAPPPPVTPWRPPARRP